MAPRYGIVVAKYVILDMKFGNLFRTVMEAREDGESVEEFQALVYFFLVVSSISCIVFVFFILHNYSCSFGSGSR